MGIQPIRKTVTPEIPDKLYFRIGDVARLCEVPAYVLRFWETEFPQLKPTKGGTGQRLYRKRDVEMALRIKSLLYDQRYTIPGARQVFKDEAKARESAAAEAFTPAPAPAETVSPVSLQPTMAADALPASPALDPAPDSGVDLRRRMQLRAIRDELRALLTQLETPRSAFAGSAQKAAAEIKPMRPRLVLEPRPAAGKPETLRLETLRLVRDDAGRDALNQGDLFSGE